MKSFILITLLSFILSSCGQKEDLVYLPEKLPKKEDKEGEENDKIAPFYREFLSLEFPISIFALCTIEAQSETYEGKRYIYFTRAENFLRVYYVNEDFVTRPLSMQLNDKEVMRFFLQEKGESEFVGNIHQAVEILEGQARPNRGIMAPEIFFTETRVSAKVYFKKDKGQLWIHKERFFYDSTNPRAEKPQLNSERSISFNQCYFPRSLIEE